MSNVGGDATQCPVFFPKFNVDNRYQKASKIRYYIFEILSNFTVFLQFVSNILARIVGTRLTNWQVIVNSDFILFFFFLVIVLQGLEIFPPPLPDTEFKTAFKKRLRDSKFVYFSFMTTFTFTRTLDLQEKQISSQNCNLEFSDILSG